MTDVRDNLLSVRNVVCEFSRRESGKRGRCRVDRVVDDVSFDLRAGDAMALVGESGSGKTTLARMIIGAIAPTSGVIELMGAPMGRDHRPCRSVQMIYQDSTGSLNPRLTIATILREPLDVLAIGSRTQRSRRIREVLDRVGLHENLLARFPHELSGGQRQRVAIARALIVEPELLMCDEPTSALDVSVQAEIIGLLMELRKTFNLTLLFITHNLAVARQLCDEVGVMYRGRIIEKGKIDDVFRHPQEAFTRRLRDSVLDPLIPRTTTAPQP